MHLDRMCVCDVYRTNCTGIASLKVTPPGIGTRMYVYVAVIGKSQIKSQIPKQQKGFSKHISILLVQANGNHWNFHFRSSAFTCIDLAVQSLPLIITESELLSAYISDG